MCIMSTYIYMYAWDSDVPRLRHRPPSPTSKSLQFRPVQAVLHFRIAMELEIFEAFRAAGVPDVSSASPRKSTFPSGELFCHEMDINQLLIVTS